MPQKSSEAGSEVPATCASVEDTIASKKFPPFFIPKIHPFYKGRASLRKMGKLSIIKAISK